MKTVAIIVSGLLAFSTTEAFAGTVAGGDYEIHQKYGSGVMLRFFNTSWSDCGTTWIVLPDIKQVAYVVDAAYNRKEIKISYSCNGGGMMANSVGPRY